MIDKDLVLKALYKKELRWLREEPKSHASFFFLYHVLCINQLLGTKTTCSASYGKEKTPSPNFYPPRHQGKSHQPKSLWYETNRTPATQNKKSPSD